VRVAAQRQGRRTIEIVVEDTGDAQEVRIKVTLTIEQRPEPIVATRTIEVINPGEQKVVSFRNLPAPVFATRVKVKVDVQAVPGRRTPATTRPPTR